MVSENEYGKHPHALFAEQAVYAGALLHCWPFVSPKEINLGSETRIRSILTCQTKK